MVFFTKWWYAVPVDGPDKYYWGFPLAFAGEGFHTSGSLQLFLLEFVVDVVFHVVCLLSVFHLCLRLNIQPFKNKWVPRIAWVGAVLCIICAMTLLCVSNPVIHAKRPYLWEVRASGYKFIWQQTPYLVPDNLGNN
jgi:hypothetical protein